MWTPADLVFKKALNKRVTSSLKQFYEEFGDLAIDVNASEVKFQPVPFDNPPLAISNGVAEQRNLLVMSLDNSVAGNQAWFAQSGVTRLENWLSDKYGPSFTIHLFDNSNNEIFPTDPVGWIFDYVTGVLMFNGSTAGFSQPFKISGYRYIGTFLSNAVIGGGGGHVIQYNGVPFTQRAALNFTGTSVSVTDDSVNNRTIVAIAPPAAPGVLYTPVSVPNWSFAPATPANVQDALDDIVAYLALTAPAQAPTLTGQNLAFAGQSVFTGKLPLGLPASWYTLAPAGSTVNNVLYGGVFTLKSTIFRAGSANTPATYGTISAAINSVTVNSYAMSGGNGSNGIIQASGLAVFNSIWESALGTINANQATEGSATYTMVHTGAGTSNPFSVYLDNSAVAVTFPGTLTLSVNSVVNKFLSGVAYLGLGTVLNVGFTIAGAFQKVYVASGVAQLVLLGAPNTLFDPVSTPNYTDNFIVASTITLSVANLASTTPVATVTARKPNNPAAASSNFNVSSISNGISTYGIVSTVTNEPFQDEAQRLNSGSLTAFVSSAVLANGEAQVIPGAVIWKAGNGVTQLFTRRFTKAAANNGTIGLSNITAVGQVGSFGNGNVNVFLKLETDNIWFDLGLPFGAVNGTGSGNSQANSIGARVSFSSTGGIFSYSFGTYSTAGNGNQYLFQMILQTGSPPMNDILTA